ncbi:MAG: MmcQ/YjbR family DNA-binding protein [Planctomycetia bacterium]|nr:MmcQ/YjbR family DNA-binding protein [Planctomycetia bacterium]
MIVRQLAIAGKQAPSDSLVPRNNPLRRVESALRKHALLYPLAREDFPWEHSAFKVKGKVFLFMGWDKETLGLSVKLPQSGKAALQLPFAFPTRYGLGKSGWVSATFQPGDAVPLEMLLESVDESYRAIAPRKAVAKLEGADEEPAGGAGKRATPGRVKRRQGRSSR